MSNLLDLLQDGKQHPISQAQYEQLLDQLPPVCMATRCRDERWDLGLAEGADHVYLFRQRGGDHFAIKTPYLNPYEAGGFEIQKRRWILKWIELAKQNVSFRQAGSPPIGTHTFHEYASDDGLLAEAPLGDWRGGQALFVGNLCFIKLATDGEEWLAIKDNRVLGKTPASTG